MSKDVEAFCLACGMTGTTKGDQQRSANPGPREVERPATALRQLVGELCRNKYKRALFLVRLRDA
jgi:hypothetical protein